MGRKALIWEHVLEMSWQSLKLFSSLLTPKRRAYLQHESGFGLSMGRTMGLHPESVRAGERTHTVPVFRSNAS